MRAHAFTLADKLAPPLLRAFARGEASLGPLQIVAWPGDEGALQSDLRGLRVAAAAPADRVGIQQIAALESVRWIEPLGQPKLLNDAARAIIAYRRGGLAALRPVWRWPDRRGGRLGA